MLCVLSGGTGTPKLLQGLREIFDLSIIVNTAEDIWVSGNKICPDIDSVIYSLSGVIDDEKWWGIKGDTFETYSRLKELGFDEGLMIGDLDRATHIIRSELLRKAYSLTEAIEELKNRFEIAERILPMCEEEIESIVVTSQGEMHFQDFWVKHRGEPDVVDVKFAGIENARMTEEVEIVLDECDAVVIGPSNPITSIMPIISVNGFNKKLKNKKVLAVSPIIGKKAFSGPAGKLMRAKGFEVSPTGVADCYREFLDVLIVDEVDSHLAGTHGKYEIVSTKTIIKDKKEALELAKFIGEVI